MSFCSRLDLISSRMPVGSYTSKSEDYEFLLQSGILPIRNPLFLQSWSLLLCLVHILDYTLVFLRYTVSTSDFLHPFDPSSCIFEVYILHPTRSCSYSDPSPASWILVWEPCGPQSLSPSENLLLLISFNVFGLIIFQHSVWMHHDDSIRQDSFLLVHLLISLATRVWFEPRCWICGQMN